MAIKRFDVETAVTLSQINKALKAKGYDGVLYKGKGYFYFAEGEASNWHSPSVYVYTLNELSLKQWIEEYETKRKENDRDHQDRLNEDRYSRKIR